MKVSNTPDRRPIELDPDDVRNDDWWNCLHQSLATLERRDAKLILKYRFAENRSMRTPAEIARES